MPTGLPSLAAGGWGLGGVGGGEWQGRGQTVVSLVMFTSARKLALSHQQRSARCPLGCHPWLRRGGGGRGEGRQGPSSGQTRDVPNVADRC
jgi:hypothetical protein